MICVKHVPEMIFHVLMQLIIRAPLYWFLYRMMRNYLSTGAVGTDTLWMALCVIASFILLVLPARFIFGEILRKWADEYRKGERQDNRMLAFEESVIHALKRYPVCLLAGLRRMLKGAGSFPWAGLAVFIFYYYTVFAYHLDNYKASNAIIGGVPMMFLGSELKTTEQLFYGVLSMLIMIACCGLLAVLYWQRCHGAEYRLQPEEKMRGVGSIRHIWVIITNFVMDAVSLIPAAYVLYRYAYGHFDVFFSKQYDMMFKIDMAKQLLKEPLTDLGELVLRLILCIALIYLPVRILRRARGAAFISLDTARKKDMLPAGGDPAEEA